LKSVEDGWGSATAYEHFMGRWSRQIALEFLRWIEPQSGLRWLELGCGTGALTEIILDDADPASILALDPSAALVHIADGRIQDFRVSFQVGGIENLPSTPNQFDSCVSGLVLNFIEKPEIALGSIAQLLTDGGLIAAYVWDYSKGVGFLRAFWDAAVALDPNTAKLDEGVRFPLCSPAPLRSLFEDVGLKDVEVKALETTTKFDSFSDYWEPFLGGVGPAPSYVSTLGNDERRRLEEGLKSRLSLESDGAIVMTARAWGVRGYVR
jgi:ubiquinone/menaquinone biosynthesis C-methylase UbiE